MKQRILTAIVGLILMAVVLVFYNTLFFNVAIAVVAAIGVYELIHCAGHAKDTGLLVASLAFALAAPFLKLPGLPDLRTAAILVYVFLIFTILIAKHNTIQIQALCFCGMSAVAVPFSLCSLIYVRDGQMGSGVSGLYYILLIFALAWVCDGGAYFVGRKLGKHKMAPIISPNKTVEGAIGGIVTNILFSILFTLIFVKAAGWDATVNYGSLVLLAVVCSFLGMLGDLSASAIKRQYKIKDFGNLMPGHGGVIDRFDSVLFVAPAFYMVISFLPVLNFVS
ncbi:phosphatidate cytidylyltransferase [[Clostridium] methylpentosum DSM 5476]|uniref:Phosphatidate cytidylyltransferase n=1 Tax=[Clostridium] methylpentosum DSM 5476 TaxID=537013 RepID=C0EER4_9FIRM|nr:phosphatidate cytidylyltransferase [[Clostridium] methylpentosum DSM 5476]MDY3989495.1 phosphatidate cytidylyltransferase [Massilioclostridium sp.]MEE1491433.1 phosphatidate cytidylyltransferase [Massilioclostridium sp.]